MLSTAVGEIPVIEFDAFLAAASPSQEAIAQQIYRACRDVGFMYLTDHGITSGLIDRALAESQQFFQLPAATKQRYAWTNAISNRGYIGMETEQLEPDRPADWKEAFSIRQDFTNSDPDLQNKWPQEQPSFRPAMLELYDACSQLANQVLHAFALALHQPPSYFSRHHGRNYTLRLLHYPPAASALKAGQVRAGAHSDYGCITLLFQDQVGGLEILSKTGEWMAAPCIPGTVLVNIGDLMQRWTNHEFRSTVHRVVQPPEPAGGRSRYSIAFFGHPNLETDITCLEDLPSGHRPAAYPPINAADHILGQLNAAHSPVETLVG